MARADVIDYFSTEGEVVITKWKEGYIPVLISNTSREFIREYNDSMDSVSANSGHDTVRLKYDDKDITYIDNEEKKYYHCMVGVSPSLMRHFIRIPESKGLLQSFENLPVPSKSSPYGYQDGVDSPYDEPSPYHEFFVPPKIHVGHEFYNPDDIAHTPTLNIFLSLYELEILDFDKHKDLIKQAFEAQQMESQGAPLIHTMGARDEAISFYGSGRSLDDTWNTKPAKVHKLLEAIQ